VWHRAESLSDSNPTANLAGSSERTILSRHKAHGRRRASGPVVETRPRDPHRSARRNRNQLVRISESASASVEGLGQRAAIVVAASGLAMAVTVPAASVTLPGQNVTAETSSGSTLSAAAVTAPAPVTAPETASVTFDRASLGSGFDPDRKLHSVMTAAGETEPAAADGTLDKPVAASNMTSGFGHRVNPITGFAGEKHTGQDFGIACGTGVKAAADGTVKEAGWHPFGGGNRIVVDHGGGLETTYNHLSSMAVSPGQQVSRGQSVGMSGTTGASTGCHLHFEVVVNGQKVDPLGWL
jgi:murein DD-endopeptidase MepM/ murein hydrolase activator NlpD